MMEVNCFRGGEKGKVLLNLRDVSQEKWQEACKNVLMKKSISSYYFIFKSGIWYGWHNEVMYAGVCLSFVGVENFLKSFSKQDFFVFSITFLFFLKKKRPVFSCGLCIDCNSWTFSLCAICWMLKISRRLRNFLKWSGNILNVSWKILLSGKMFLAWSKKPCCMKIGGFWDDYF